MTSQIATAVYISGIVALFMLNRDRTTRTSMALWVPVVWLLIAGSRNVSEWLELSGPRNAVDRYLEGSPIDFAILTTLIALGAITLASRGRRVGEIVAANKPMLAFFLYCGLSVLWSDYPFVGFKRWIRGLGDVIMVLVILTDLDWVAAFKRTLTRAGFLLLPISMLLIRYYPELGRAFGRWDGIVYWTGVATHKNSLGMICVVFGLASVWRFLVAYQAQEGSGRMRLLIAHGSMVAIAFWVLWIADSKTSLSCFLLAGGLISVTRLSSFARRPTVLQSMVIAAVLGTAATLFMGVGGGALEAMGRDSSLTGRTEIWHTVLGFAENPLLGAGYENFWLGRRLYAIYTITGGLNQAHNGYIEIYLNLGWIGLTLLAVLILTGYRTLFAEFRSGQEASILKISFFTVALIYNFTEFTFKMTTPVWIAFLLAIIAIPHSPGPDIVPTAALGVRSNWFRTGVQEANPHP